MKAIIVDKKDKYAVALTPEGRFIRIKNSDEFRIGYEVDIDQFSSFNFAPIVKRASIAAVFVLILSFGFGLYSYANPYNYICLDVNPSIEVKANRFDRVLSVEPLNQDGTKILSKTNFKNMKLQNALNDILARIIAQNYIKTDSNNIVVFTVYSKDKASVQKTQNDIKALTNKELETYKVKSSVVLQESDVKNYKNAKTLGISPGKLLLIKKIASAPKPSDIEAYKNKSVSELINASKEKITQKSDSSSKPDNEPATAKNKDNGNSSKNDAKNDSKTDDKQNKEPVLKKDAVPSSSIHSNTNPELKKQPNNEKTENNVKPEEKDTKAIEPTNKIKGEKYKGQNNKGKNKK